MGNVVKISAAVTSRKGMSKDQNYNDYYLNGKYVSEQGIDNSRAFAENSSADFIFAVSNAMSIEDLQDNTKISITGELTRFQERIKEGRGDIGARLNDLCQKIEETNSLVYSISLNNKDNRRNETAFSGLVVNKTKAAAISIGDTNVYIFRNARLRRLILDKEKPDKLLKMGIINEDQAKVIAQGGGASLHESIMGAQVSEAVELNSNDIFVLSSGRLEDLIDEETITDILLSGAEVNIITEKITKEIAEANPDIDVTILTAKVTKIFEETIADEGGSAVAASKWSDRTADSYEKKQENIRTFIVAALTVVILAAIIGVTYNMLKDDDGEGEGSGGTATAYVSPSGQTAPAGGTAAAGQTSGTTA
ncbi:MAG: hypothetical protein PHG48_00150, partial [Eubacteriales bacterium]|nr:hypothetical protein [Eubacteriales bacterium]